MEKHNQPFVCRVHSFDVDRERVRRILNHPLCVGVFAHPHHVEQLPTGVLPLIPTVSPRTIIPESPAERGLVLSVSAGLPKKDFAFLVETLAQVSDLDRMIILAGSNGFDEVPASVEQLVAEVDPSIAVRINVPRVKPWKPWRVRRQCSSTRCRREPPWGTRCRSSKRCCAGRSRSHPIDRRPGRSWDQASAPTATAPTLSAIREVARGGDAVEHERRALIQLAQRHRHPMELVRLHDALRDGLTEWRAKSVEHDPGRPFGDGN